MKTLHAESSTARLQVALATVQQQAGEAVVVDGYKAMYTRLVQDRAQLLERAVELEHSNMELSACITRLQEAAAAPPKVRICLRGFPD